MELVQRQLGGASLASLQPLPFFSRLSARGCHLLCGLMEAAYRSNGPWSCGLFSLSMRTSLVSHIEGFILSFIHLATSGFARAARSSTPSTFSIQSTINESFASAVVSLIRCIHIRYLSYGHFGSSHGETLRLFTFLSLFSMHRDYNI